MCTLQYPRGQIVDMNMNEFYFFPWLDHLKRGDPLPTHICLRNVLHKKIYDQRVRTLFEKYDMDAEPGGVADILRACLGASAPKGSGRLSADVGLRWVRKTKPG